MKYVWFAVTAGLMAGSAVLIIWLLILVVQSTNWPLCLFAYLWCVIFILEVLRER